MNNMTGVWLLIVASVSGCIPMGERVVDLSGEISDENGVVYEKCIAEFWTNDESSMHKSEIIGGRFLLSYILGSLDNHYVIKFRCDGAASGSVKVRFNTADVPGPGIPIDLGQIIVKHKTNQRQ